MSTQEREEQAQRRSEWQDQFTMCGQFQWHLRGEDCDCGPAEVARADKYVAKYADH